MQFRVRVYDNRIRVKPLIADRGFTYPDHQSLLIAVLVYMGWPYEDAFYGYFHLSPLDLDVGVVEYMLISAICALRATSLYAQSIGTWDARALVRSLPSRAAVVVYSTQRLALSGPGVTVQLLKPGFYYHFGYQGFRLLTTRSGTYYILPVGWSPRLDITYILSESDQVRIELESGVVRSNI